MSTLISKQIYTLPGVRNRWALYKKGDLAALLDSHAAPEGLIDLGTLTLVLLEENKPFALQCANGLFDKTLALVLDLDKLDQKKLSTKQHNQKYHINHYFSNILSISSECLPLPVAQSWLEKINQASFTDKTNPLLLFGLQCFMRNCIQNKNVEATTWLLNHPYYQTLPLFYDKTVFAPLVRDYQTEPEKSEQILNALLEHDSGRQQLKSYINIEKLRVKKEVPLPLEHWYQKIEAVDVKKKIEKEVPTVSKDTPAHPFKI